MKVTRSIRFDPEQIEKAEKLGIDVSEVCRNALADEITRKSNPKKIAEEILWARKLLRQMNEEGM